MSFIKKLLVKIGADNSELKGKVKDSNTTLDSFANKVKQVGVAIGVAFGAREVIRFGAEVVQLSAKFRGIERAFKRIAPQGLLQDLRDATMGTVSDLELMQKAVQASNFQLPLESLASLFEFAAKRAQDTGESVDYLVNSIVLGIGRKSPLILDNLGISAVRLRQELKGAGVEMNTVADIAAAVGKIAQSEMKKAGDMVEDTGVKIQQLKADWQELKIAAGGAIADIYAYLAEGYRQIKESSAQATADRNMEEFFGASIRAYQEMATEEERVTAERVANYQKAKKTLEKGIDFSSFKGLTIGDFFGFEDYIKNSGPLTDLMVELTRLQEDLNRVSEDEIGIINRKIKEKEQEITNLKEKIKLAPLDIEYLKKAADATDNLSSQTYDLNDITDRNIENLESEIDALMELEDEMGKVAMQAAIMELAWKSVGEAFKEASTYIAGDFADSLGYAIATGEGFEGMLADLGSSLLNALGDILIIAGLSGLPTTLPLLLLGLTAKLGGGLLAGAADSQRAKASEQMAVSTSGTMKLSGGDSTLYGNDIRLANNYSNQLYDRVG